MTNETTTSSSPPPTANGTATSEVYPPPARVRDRAYVRSMAEYEEMYQRSLRDPEGFWKAIAQDFYWKHPPKPGKFFDYNIDVRKGPVHIQLDGRRQDKHLLQLARPKCGARSGLHRRLLLGRQ
ncbi:hypothetical protein MTO96_047705 [Rhipicephalus appendiculatus]